MKKFQSGFEVKIAIKVYPEFFNQGPLKIPNQGLMEIDQSKAAQNFPIEIGLKFF
ncbi:MAG: hypothetical protein Q8T08_05990 [Ignavibacteria bacterium]|nr:hypothetical protein [Ignavibacteria bacterium]